MVACTAEEAEEMEVGIFRTFIHSFIHSFNTYLSSAVPDTEISSSQIVPTHMKLRAQKA